ncbi:HlyD family type I secretion periplasmic adaptor subunit [Niveibacterium umoris]|uniref:Membrane fusion protein (MFP) family protein n=1 Tax=Niveibacterium umoris TaxID=1193620 RepID=A0A840BT55_9RHOO|nr:HlyD family type I secretion periplasmic adaptor subunit [Niveibacterium umoris]MBB4014589.1 HlyD family type I secretion membrane fusion protein [Niveibacterium umoris]
MAERQTPTLRVSAKHELLRWSRLTTGATVLCALSLLVWGALAPLNSAVVARGLIRVEGGARQVVQHRDGGTVKRILVRNGDHVKAGQALIELEDAEVAANSELVAQQIFAETARQARLRQEVAFSPRVDWPKELTRRATTPGYAELLKAEELLFEQRRHTLDLQLDITSKQLFEVEREVSALHKQVESDQAAVAATEAQVRINEPLQSQGYVSPTRLLDLRRALADYQSRLAENRANMSRAAQKRGEMELRKQALRNAYRESAIEEQKQSAARMVELTQRGRPASDALKRQTVVAPSDGVLMNLKVHTVGAALMPREVLMEIVPADARLVAEVRLPVDAISEVRPGMAAEVRLLAFQMRSTPLVAARLSYVSADVLSDPSGAPYYSAEVTLDRASLKAAQIGAIQPGMPIEVFLKTRERSAIGYLFDPVRLSLSRAFRER